MILKKKAISGCHFYAHDMGDSVLTEIVSQSMRNQLPKFFSDGIQSLTFTNGGMVLHQVNMRFMQKLPLSHPKTARFLNIMCLRTGFRKSLQQTGRNKCNMSRE